MKKRAAKSHGAQTTPRRIAETSPIYGADVVYVESSALLAALIEQDVIAADAIRSATTLVASALTFAECQRALIRATHARRLSADDAEALANALRSFASRCVVVSITPDILERAGRSFPVEPIRTLDGIHLATLAALNDSPTSVRVLTRDRRVQENALAMGYALA